VLILAFFDILLLALVAALLCDKKWEDTIPISLFFVLITEYLLGLSNFLEFTKYFKVFLMFLCALFIVIYAYRNTYQNLWKKFTPGILLYLLTCILLIVLFYHHRVTQWDDFSHWATNVKQFFSIDAFPKGINSSSDYSDYPPIYTLLSYFVLSGNKIFQGNSLFMVNGIYLFTMLLPLFKKIEIKEKVNSIFIFLFTLSIPFVVLEIFTRYLTVDCFVTMTFAYCIYLVLSYDGKNKLIYFSLLFGLCVLVLAKSVGILLALIALLLLFILSFHPMKPISFLVRFLSNCCMSAIVIVLYQSWKVFCTMNGNSSYISGGFNTIKISDFHELLTQIPLNLSFDYKIFILAYFIFLMLLFIPVWRKSKIALPVVGIVSLSISLYVKIHYSAAQLINLGTYTDSSPAGTIIHYFNGFFSQSLNGTIYGLTGFDILLCMLILLYAFAKIKNIVFYHYFLGYLVLCLGLIIYVTGHLSLYVYVFSEPEVLGLSSFTRYLGMYVAGFFVGYLLLLPEQLCNLMSGKNYRIALIILTISGLVFINYKNLTDHLLFYKETCKNELELQGNIKNSFSVISENSLLKSDHILLVSNYGMGWNGNCARLYCSPNRTINFNLNTDFASALGTWNDKISRNEFQYIFISDCDYTDDQKSVLRDIFAQFNYRDPVKSGDFFKIDLENQELYKLNE